MNRITVEENIGKIHGIYDKINNLVSYNHSRQEKLQLGNDIEYLLIDIKADLEKELNH